RVVLAAPAEDLERALELLGASDQRIERAGAGPLGQVDAVGGQRNARGGRFGFAGTGGGRGVAVAGRGLVRRRRLWHAVRDVVENVEAGDALVGEQPRRLALRLLQQGGEDVAGVGFLALRRLHVEDRGLQHLTEGRRLFRVVAAAARQPLDRGLQIGA